MLNAQHLFCKLSFCPKYGPLREKGKGEKAIKEKLVNRKGIKRRKGDRHEREE